MANNTKLVMPGDGAVNPFTVPGTSRKYSCAAGATIAVPDADADMMLCSGWVNSIGKGATLSGPTSGRPTPSSNPPVFIGMVYNDTTVGAAVVYAGPKTGWLHHATGASS